MPAAPLPADEAQRLQALAALKVLDTPPEQAFDALVRAAAMVCEAPISLISLVDESRQWFKANVGLEGATQTPREQAFCAHAILQDGVFEVPDATLDPRFADNALVTGAPDIRFYAGAVLSLSDGARVGTLCVIDQQPRQLTERQRAVLAELGVAASKALESRRAAHAFHASEARFRALSEAAPLPVFAADAAGQVQWGNERWEQWFGSLSDAPVGMAWWQRIHLADRAAVQEAWRLSVVRLAPVEALLRVMAADGELRQLRLLLSTTRSGVQQDLVVVGTVEDITAQSRARQQAESLLNTVRQQFIMSVTDANGTIIEVNDAFCAISQYPREALLGANHRIVNSGIHPRLFFHGLWSAITQGRSWRGEICNRSSKGELYWVDSVIAPLPDDTGRVTRYVSIRSDITARKRQQQALQQSADMLDRTGRLAQVGSWELDLDTEKLTWSEQTSRIYGVPANYQPTLREALEFFPPSARAQLKQALQRARVLGVGWDLELPFVRGDGESLWVRSVCQPGLHQSPAQRLNGAVQDITQQVRQRLALEATHQRMTLATDGGAIGIWDIDLETQHLNWDAWMHKLHGQKEHLPTVSLASWIALIEPSDQPQVQAAFAQTLQNGTAFEVEYRQRWHDGSLRYLRVAAHVERCTQQARVLRMIGVCWDLTPLRQLTAELAEQHELLRVTLQSIGDAVITTDASGRVTWLNPAAERMTGWTSAEATNRPLDEVFHIVHEETRHRALSPLSACLTEGRSAGLPHQTLLISRGGLEFGIEDSGAPIRNAQGELLGMVLVFHDVTEQRRLSGEMSYRATHDPLTGLVNRTEFETRLRRALQRAHEDGGVHALMYIDLDQFKLVNDACGHSVGDQLLQQVARLFADTVRARDTLARLGGDEFAVILEHCTSEQAQRVAQQICERMDDFRFLHDGRRFRIGASIGLVPVDKRWSNPTALLQAADTSCYAAKEAGRNRVHTWFDTDRAMHARQGEMRWASRLEQALDESRFQLFAQVITPLRPNGAGLYAEILLRLQADDGELVLPGAFMPAAERFNLATRIDRHVLQRVLDLLASLPDDGAMGCLSVNLSGQSVGDKAFHRHAIETLTAAGPRCCRQLCLEITETAAVTNIADASNFIAQVRALGVQVALDDFGAGASSFGYLKSLQVDSLKIDGQFIRDLIDDPLDDAAVRCFVDVAKVLAITTVAEFVDRADILARLQAVGVDHVQGYLLHKPEPLANLLQRPSAQGRPLAALHH